MVRWWLLGGLATLFVAACILDVDDTLCVHDDHCDEGEVCAVTRRCVACADEQCPPSVRCESNDDCDEEENCATDGVCRARCVIDAQCPSGSCAVPVCAAAFGEPCDPEYDTRTPCAGKCIDTDNQLEAVPAYCSHTCLPTVCPEGFECVNDYCRVVTGELVCNHPSPDAPCGSCAWEYCGYDLEDCCEGAICDDVLGQIALCDAQRDFGSCSPLGFPSGFLTTSQELADCIAIFCDDGLCFVD